jgi:hypothetical protein
MKNKIFIVGIIGIMLVFGFVFTACSSDSEDDSWTEISKMDEESLAELVQDLLGTSWKGSTPIGISRQTIPMDGEDNPLKSFGITEIKIPSTSVSLDLTFRLTDTFEAFAGGTVYLNNILDNIVKLPELGEIITTLKTLQDEGEPLDEDIEYFINLFFPDGIPSEITKDLLWDLLTQSSEILPSIFGPDIAEYLGNVEFNDDDHSLIVKELELPFPTSFESDETEGSANDPRIEINQDNTKIRIIIPVDNAASPIKLDKNNIVIELEKQQP